MRSRARAYLCRNSFDPDLHDQQAAENAAGDGRPLIELMIAIGIIAVIATVAIPTYRGYIDSGRQGALFNNIASMEIFQEDLRLRV